VKLLTDKSGLGHEYLGNWQDRTGNSNVEEACSALEDRWLPLDHALRNLLLMPTPSLVAAIESGSQLGIPR